MNLTENFTYEELIKSDTARIRKISNIPDEHQKKNLKRLAKDLLQPIRDAYGKPITVTSGFRCEELNRAVGGSKTSAHRYGLAADILCDDNRRLWNVILSLRDEGKIDFDQLIDEKNLKWIHIGLSEGKNRNQILFL